MFTIKCNNREIDPGPASIGMANGVKAISFLVCASLSTFYYLCFLLNSPESSENPEVAITIPPAIRKASMLIPKRQNVFPKKGDNHYYKNIYSGPQRNSGTFFLSSSRKSNKIGTVPIG
jgi:hypothetical protein